MFANFKSIIELIRHKGLEGARVSCMLGAQGERLSELSPTNTLRAGELV